MTPFVVVQGRFGAVNHVFLNAGFEGNTFKSITDIPRSEWRKVFAINIDGVMSGYQVRGGVQSVYLIP